MKELGIPNKGNHNSLVNALTKGNEGKKQGLLTSPYDQGRRNQEKEEKEYKKNVLSVPLPSARPENEKGLNDIESPTKEDATASSMHLHLSK